MRRFTTRIALALVMVLAPLGGLAGAANAAPFPTSTPALRTPYTRQIPATGTVRIPAIVIDFDDSRNTMSETHIVSTLFGVGKAEKAPMVWHVSV